MYRSSTTVQYWERSVDYLRFATARARSESPCCRGGFRIIASRAYDSIASTPDSSMRAGWRLAIAYRSAPARRLSTLLAAVPGLQVARIALGSASASLENRRCQSSSSTAPPALPPASSDLRRLMRKVAQPVAVITANLKDASSVHEPGEHDRRQRGSTRPTGQADWARALHRPRSYSLFLRVHLHVTRSARRFRPALAVAPGELPQQRCRENGSIGQGSRVHNQDTPPHLFARASGACFCPTAASGRKAELVRAHLRAFPA